MQSKVLGLVHPKSKVVGGTVRGAEQLKDQLSHSHDTGITKKKKLNMELDCVNFIRCNN